MKKRFAHALFLLVAAPLLVPGTARPEVPYPSPPPGVDPGRFEDYCFLRREGGQPVLPRNYAGRDVWKYASTATDYVEIGDNPKPTGMSVDRAWEITTGRPDVVIAVLDSGVRWDDPTLNDKFRLNRFELPLPQGSAVYDANGDGVFNMEDYRDDGRVADVNGNGLRDPEDLLYAFSDGRDADGNGYVDDICGWDMLDDDNDPFDDVDYGHGTGQSQDSCREAYADRTDGFPGTCPNCMVLPVRVGQSYMAEDTTFGNGVVFAVDSGADVIQEALGGLTFTSHATAAIEYAYGADVPIIASAADEESMHQNIPAVHEHMIVLNSVTRHADGMSPPSYLYLSGCTNYGGNIAVSVSSTSCSSEAVGRGAGIAGLVVSAAKDEVARGRLAAPLTANEVAQVLTMSADDIDFAGHYEVEYEEFETVRFPSGPGWDQFFGYGRMNAREAVRRVTEGRIPPEADLTEPRWFQTFDPAVHPRVEISGRVAADRSASYSYVVEWGRGVQPGPSDWQVLCESQGLDAPREGTLCTWDVSSLLPEVSHAAGWHNEFAFTVRVVVRDAEGNRAVSRKTVYLHHDPALRNREALHFPASGESGVVTADLDGDNVEDLVFSDSDGFVQALRGGGSTLAGWPVRTDPLAFRYEGSAAYRSGAMDPDVREPIGAGGVAVGDLDRDGDPEVVAASLAGKVYAWEHDGSPRPGFPVSLHLPYSLNPAYTPYEQYDARDKFNRRLAGVMSAPVLEDLDRDGRLEIVCAALDNHVYAWRDDGTPLPGWPVLVVDRVLFDVVDDTTHRIVPASPASRFETGKIVSTPAVGDIDGDGMPEIVVGTNEQYDEPMNIGLFSGIFGIVARLELMGGNARLHALRAGGHLDPGGPFVPGWPVKIALLVPEMVPYVAYGYSGSPVLADLDGDRVSEIVGFSASGPVYVLRGDGTSFYGADPWGSLNVLDSGGLLDPDHDLPTIAGLGSPIVADLVGDGSLSPVGPSVGWKGLYDTRLPALQVGAEKHITAWSVETRRILPGFPHLMDDLQFQTSPTVVDVDADGLPEVIEGSGGFLVRATNALGEAPAGWPKHTGRWIVSPPAVGDVDGDGRLEVSVRTRMGDLYVWNTAAPACDPASRQWRTFHHDACRTGLYGKDVVPPGRPADLRAERDGRLLRMTWTAVGDDGVCGGPVAYEIRGAGADPETAWQDAREIGSLGAAYAPGGPVDASVVDPGYAWVGVQAVDEAGNRSRVVSTQARPVPSVLGEVGEGSGCGCATPGAPGVDDAPAATALILAGLYAGLMAFLRKRADAGPGKH